eukprot:scaffold191139_cov15-Tisochrysis_lutea.AAC.1
MLFQLEQTEGASSGDVRVDYGFVPLPEDEPDKVHQRTEKWGWGCGPRCGQLPQAVGFAGLCPISPFALASKIFGSTQREACDLRMKESNSC